MGCIAFFRWGHYRDNMGYFVRAFTITSRVWYPCKGRNFEIIYWVIVSQGYLEIRQEGASDIKPPETKILANLNAAIAQMKIWDVSLSGWDGQ